MKDKFQIFLETLLHFGLEKLGRFYGAYRGEVTDNNDPKNLGRVKIYCSALYGTEKPDYWAWPRGSMAGSGHGIFWVPQIGDAIYVSCETGDPRFPLWEYGWWKEDSQPTGASIKAYTFLTPGGQRIELNDENNYILITNKDGFNMKLYPDGIFVGKEENNLGKYIDDLMQLLTATTTATVYGSSPFNNLADYVELKEKLALFLKTS